MVGVICRFRHLWDQKLRQVLNICHIAHVSDLENSKSNIIIYVAMDCKRVGRKLSAVDEVIPACCQLYTFLEMVIHQNLRFSLSGNFRRHRLVFIDV